MPHKGLRTKEIWEGHESAGYEAWSAWPCSKGWGGMGEKLKIATFPWNPTRLWISHNPPIWRRFSQFSWVFPLNRRLSSYDCVLFYIPFVTHGCTLNSNIFNAQQCLTKAYGQRRYGKDTSPWWGWLGTPAKSDPSPERKAPNYFISQNLSHFLILMCNPLAPQNS